MGFTLSQTDIDRLIESETVYTLGRKTTAVLLTLTNGFEVVGTSACVDPANYNEGVGAEYARKRAMDKVWELEGYAFQSEKHEALGRAKV